MSGVAGSMTCGVGVLGPSGIVMDTSKAMAVLGFSPSQTFETTSTEEINRAFMFKMHLIMSNSNKKNFNPRMKESRRLELRKINEALQFLTKKRTKNESIDEWKRGGRKSNIVAKAISALTIEDGSIISINAYREKLFEAQMLKEMESKRARALADELMANLEGEKPKSSASSGSIKRRSKKANGSTSSAGEAATTPNAVEDAATSAPSLKKQQSRANLSGKRHSTTYATSSDVSRTSSSQSTSTSSSSSKSSTTTKKKTSKSKYLSSTERKLAQQNLQSTYTRSTGDLTADDDFALVRSGLLLNQTDEFLIGNLNDSSDSLTSK